MLSIRDNLKGTFAHSEGRLRLSENPVNASFLNQTLALFDYRNQRELSNERRILSGETSMSGASLPSSYLREVIREALADLPILELIKPRTDPNANATVDIPYEERTKAVEDLANDGIVFEGQPIPFAGVSLKTDAGLVLPMKLAMKVSNEVIHFSAASNINWNAWGDSIESNARVIRELLHFRLAKEMQRASDSYLAESVTGESVTASATGLIKTAEFPVVQPFQARDLTGKVIGDPENPLNLVIDSASVPYYDGTSTTAGLYWKFSNINLGYIQLVDETGAAAGSNKTGALNYDYATNLIRFDLSHSPDTEYAKHLDGLLNAVADAKATLTSARICRPEFGLMSAQLNSEAAKAAQFAVSLTRPGTSTSSAGDLEAIKALPIWETQGGHVGNERIIIGQRGTTSYVIAKPWALSQPFEATGTNGQPTGEKISYGEEYSAIHTPKAIRSRYMSVLVYNSATR